MTVKETLLYSINVVILLILRIILATHWPVCLYFFVVHKRAAIISYTYETHVYELLPPSLFNSGSEAKVILCNLP